MKKSKLMLFGIITFVLSIVCGIFAIILGGLDGETWLDAEKNLRLSQGLHELPLAKTVSFSTENLSSLNIDVSGAFYTINTHDGDLIEIDYFEDYEGEVVATLSNQTLQLDRSVFFGSVNYDCNKNEFRFSTVGVWFFYNDYFNVEIKIPKSLNLDDVNFKVSGGKITVNGINSQIVRNIDISGGAFLANDCNYNSIENIKVSGGTVNLDNSKINSINKIDLSGGFMKILYSDLQSLNLVKVSGGYIEINDCNLLGLVDIDISGGNVRIYNLKTSADSISFIINKSGGGAYFNSSSLSDGTTTSFNPQLTINAKISGGSLRITN